MNRRIRVAIVVSGLAVAAVFFGVLRRTGAAETGARPAPGPVAGAC